MDRFGVEKSKINPMKQLLTLTFLSIIWLTYAQVPSYVPTNGLVGWWPFNGNANDESGNGNNGTVNGATLTVDRFGVANKAYSFDGINDYIQSSNISSLNSSTNSLSFWIFAPSYSVHHQIEFASLTFGTLGRAFAFNSTRLAVVPTTDCVNANTPGLHYLSGQLGVNSWYHLVFISDGSVGKFYLNGIYLGQANMGSPICQNPLTLVLGRGTNGGGPMWYEGKLDDIAIWNRALTECEIEDLYHAQVGFTTVDAGQDQTICRGAEVTLNGTGGNFLFWNNGVVNGVPFAPNQTSNYVLTGSDSLGCVGTDTVLVTVLDNASSTINQTAIDSYTLNGQTYTQSGTYTQVLTGANGCDSTIILNLELDFTGIQTNTLPSLKLYPNPVQDVLHFEGLAGKEFEYEVISIYGKLLQKGKSQGEISVKELRKGNYVLRVGQQQVSFVKQ